MSALDHLAEMVAGTFRVRAQGNSLVLSEPDQEDYLLSVNSKYFALTLDVKAKKGSGVVALPFLNQDHPGLCCKCDLIVFVPKDEGETLVLLIELKSLNVTGYLEQLRSSRAFAAYLAELGKIHGHDLGKLNFKGVLIRSRKIPAKGSTRMPKVSYQMRNGLEVCEWDRTYPLGLHHLLQAA